MGVFDTIRVGEREGQVKLNPVRCKTFELNDLYDSRLATYSIVMREGGYVNIENGWVKSWTDNPEFATVVDKWGEIWVDTDANAGLLGETYFF